MITLSRSEAISAVRKNLDELSLSGSAMYNSESTDNEDLDNIIARTLPDAINEVNLSAPLHILEGVEPRKRYTENGTPGSDYSSVSIDSKVLSFSFKGPFLRLIELRISDTPYTVDGVIMENSPEARKQLNPHIRGTYDKPRLVLLNGGLSSPSFRYYSLKTDQTFDFDRWVTSGTGTFPIHKLSYVPLAKYEEEQPDYQIADLLRSPIINHLTGLVLTIFKDTASAEQFFAAAKSMLQ